MNTLNLCYLYSNVWIDFLRLKAPSTWLFLDNFVKNVEMSNANPKIDSNTTVM